MAYNATSTYLDPRDKEIKELEAKRMPSRSPSPRRMSNESSPTRSEYAESVNEVTKDAKIIFDAMNSKSNFNVRIMNSEGICLYYVDNSSFTPKKPDVTVFEGSEKNGPIVGVCKWSHMYAKTVVFGLGDTKTHESEVRWDEMKSDSRYHLNYRWTFKSPDGQTRQFAWKRTRQAEHGANKWSSKNYKLTDEQTGQVVAIFGSNRLKSWHKLGKFTLTVDYGKEWQLTVLLTGLALIEMSRRRSRSRRASAAAGGGGGGGGGGA